MALKSDGKNLRANRDKEMAAYLKRRGIFHGVRLSKTNCPPIPKLDDVGSAKYRRMTEAQRTAQQRRG